MTRITDLADLVRLPATLTVPGDALAGATAAKWPRGRRTALLPVASVCLYWAGMALNDYSDRNLDALERPERPIPSGRVLPNTALGVAAGLTGVGLGLAAASGRQAFAVALPLAATVWTYDLLAKSTYAGPLLMGVARGLDVVLGAAGNVRAATVPALVVGAHATAVTALSRGEVHGSHVTVPVAALAATVIITACMVAAPPHHTSAATGAQRAAALTMTAAYAVSVGRAQARAVRSPDADSIRRATGAGIRGLIPLQAAHLATAGHVRSALALITLGPLARAGARRFSPT